MNFFVFWAQKLNPQSHIFALTLHSASCPLQLVVCPVSVPSGDDDRNSGTLPKRGH